jgi:uncharacterized membrane protein
MKQAVGNVKCFGIAEEAPVDRASDAGLQCDRCGRSDRRGKRRR